MQFIKSSYIHNLYSSGKLSILSSSCKWENGHKNGLPITINQTIVIKQNKVSNFNFLNSSPKLFLLCYIYCLGVFLYFYWEIEILSKWVFFSITEIPTFTLTSEIFVTFKSIHLTSLIIPDWNDSPNTKS